MKRFAFLLTVISCLFLACGGAAAATKWPAKPITVVVGFSPGGMSDLTTRIVVDKMQAFLGQPLVVQNKGGAGGMLGMQHVTRAKPDGYTIYGGSITQPLAAQFFSDSIAITVDDFDIIGGFIPHERALFAQPDAPYSSWEEFVAHVKAHPDTVSIGFGGGLWSLEVLRHVAEKEGLKWRLVAYKSGGEVSADFFGKHVDIAETGVGTAVYQGALEKRAKVIIDMSNDKIPGFESVPRLVDKGYPYPVLSEYGIICPKGTPREIREILTAALKAAMEDEETLGKLRKMGTRPRYVAPEEFKKTAANALTSLPELLERNKKIAK